MSEFDETHEAEAVEDQAREDQALEDQAPGAPAADLPEEPRWTRFDVVADPEVALAAAQRAITAGECIVLPTDTVYGIGASAFSAEAVTGLLEAKRRGRDMPPPVLIAEPAMLAALATSLSVAARSLAEAHWPGPLTLILSAHPSLRIDLGDTRGTIAVRVPDHDFTRELLRRTGPLAVSSANTSGNPASTTIDEAIRQLGNSVSVYLDAGPTRDDAPSTIVNFSGTTTGQVVRNGAIPFEVLRESAPQLVGVPVPAEESGAGEDETVDDALTADSLTDDAPTVDASEGAAPTASAPVGPVSDEAATYAGIDSTAAAAPPDSTAAAAPSDPDAE